MSNLFEGRKLKGRAVNVELGLSGTQPRARWDMEIVEGEHTGKVAKYSGKLGPDHVKYTKRDMMTIGWRGDKSSTFVADVAKANLIVEFDAEIAEYNGNSWVSARFGGAVPLAPLDTDAERNLDRMFADAGGGEAEGERVESRDIPF